MSNLRSSAFRTLALMALLYCFFLSLELIGASFKSFGKGFAEQLIEQTSNPFVGLLIGVLATSLIQSSSTTTTMTVGLVAAGGLTIEGAIPIIMGANIGTSVTNTLVSLGHATRPEEFRRAFAAATVHDFFNWITVLILFPLELATGYLRRTAGLLEGWVEGVGGAKLLSPVKVIVKPVAGLIEDLSGSGLIALILGTLLLFVALKLLVDLLKLVMSGRAEAILHRTLFRSPLHALVAGALITAMVQSSSITTSTVVPLVGAGVATLAQIFPFTLGANIGTTITALLAALASGNPAAIAVALAHLLFNVTGTLIIYPIPWLRRIPLVLATSMGDLGARNRPLAGVYVLVVFFGIPLLLLFLFGGFDFAGSG